jgi:ATP-dependent RNA/DNA helicase IGHMBP2
VGASPKGTTAAVDVLRALMDAWQRERATTQARFDAERRALPLAERVARGLALRDLAIEETDGAAGGRLLLWLAPREARLADELRFSPGDPVRLWWDRPDEEGAALGVVARRRGHHLGVIVDGDLPERFDDEGFRLDLDAPRTTFDRGARALNAFAEARAGSDRHRLREVLYGVRKPDFDHQEIFTPFDGDLNLPQRAAVGRALAACDVALIHGPPGTGKTRTLVEVIRQAAARGQRILATAASNTAVDNLAERLVAAGLAVVRLGHPARVAPALEAHTLDALLHASEHSTLARRWLDQANALRRRLANRAARGQLQREERRALAQTASGLLRDARKLLQSAQEAILDGAQVICATAAGADVTLLGARSFDLVVLDEATQAVDPVALVALARARRAVLAGDPHQLPPTVVDPEAARAGLAVTAFERLFARTDADPVRMLVVQHRMHRALMAFPSDSMYGGQLEADPTVAGHELHHLDGVAFDPLRPGPLAFIDTAGRGWEDRRTGDDPSTSNPDQADRVAAEVLRLLGRGLAPSDLAVITPYDAQARLLREHLRDAVESGLEVGTVDGFQGREKEAVVVDLVRSNDAGDIGFLADTRRMNVALTRARRFLLVVGDSATIGKHPYYKDFLDHVEAAGAWISAWADSGLPGPPAPPG